MYIHLNLNLTINIKLFRTVLIIKLHVHEWARTSSARFVPNEVLAMGTSTLEI